MKYDVAPAGRQRYKGVAAAGGTPAVQRSGHPVVSHARLDFFGDNGIDYLPPVETTLFGSVRRFIPLVFPRRNLSDLPALFPDLVRECHVSLFYASPGLRLRGGTGLQPVLPRAGAMLPILPVPSPWHVVQAKLASLAAGWSLLKGGLQVGSFMNCIPLLSCRIMCTCSLLLSNPCPS